MRKVMALVFTAVAGQFANLAAQDEASPFGAQWDARPENIMHEQNPNWMTTYVVSLSNPLTKPGSGFTLTRAIVVLVILLMALLLAFRAMRRILLVCGIMISAFLLILPILFFNELPPDQEFIVSSELVLGGGKGRAVIYRMERELSGGMDGPLEAFWTLRVTKANGTVREIQVNWTNDGDPDKLRNLRYTLAWDGEEDAIICTTSQPGRDKKVYLIGDALAVASMRRIAMIGDGAKPITREMRKGLSSMGRPADEFDGLKYVSIDGTYCGAGSTDFISLEENVFIVAGPNYKAHGTIIARGPIVAWGRSNLNSVVPPKWVFFVDSSSPSLPCQ